MIGTGTSLVVVEEDGRWRRATGTCFGGGTYSGLAHLLTGETDLASMAQAVTKGDLKKLDLTVGDVYGEAVESLNLPADLLASSFSKPCPASPGHPGGATTGDKLVSLLTLTAWTMAQLSCWVAKYHGALDIVFLGGLTSDLAARRGLSWGVEFEGGGGLRTWFVPPNVSPFAGALGALHLVLKN
eukprot:gb/GEZN01020939.1/.p1 GENE.gb/GEZN01020939.1/~~gb/GEZN01020939.1/.p1  ORF type:complete len:214 (-),score=43.03 gb/GEZN01020939.1/:25-579(-)